MASLLRGRMPHTPRGTLTPLIPLSLSVFKGEGEIRTEGNACATHMRLPLVQYWGEGERDGKSKAEAHVDL